MSQKFYYILVCGAYHMTEIIQAMEGVGIKKKFKK